MRTQTKVPHIMRIKLIIVRRTDHGFASRFVAWLFLGGGARCVPRGCQRSAGERLYSQRTLETGDLDRERELPEEQPSAAANRISSAISEAPSEHRPMIEKIAEDVLDGLRRLN